MCTRALIVLTLITLSTVLPGAQQPPVKPAGAAPSSAKPRYGSWGVDLAAMDKSVKPGDSFWHYVNGQWDRRTEIPTDRSSFPRRTQ